MVDPDPGYRPRRAFSDPAAAGKETGTPPSAEPSAANAAQPSSGSAAQDPAAAADGGEAPPLFRDEVAGGPTKPVATAPDGTGGVAAADASTRRLNFQQRRPQPAEDDATALLPRTPAGGRQPGAGRDEDLDDDHPRGLLGPRGRLALIIGAVAAVVVVGIALIYAVASVGTPSAQPSVVPGSSSVPATTAPSATDGGGLLADTALLTPTSAEQIASDGSWTVALTERGADADTPTAACLSDDPVDGEPVPQQEVARLLSSTGKTAPSALHLARAYGSPEDAAQAFAVAARTFGGCPSAGSYIAAGSAVTGLGDQSTGLIVNVVADGKTQWHSIVLSRTGRVLNVIDAARSDKAPGVRDVAEALAAVTDAQCQAAGGQCAADPKVNNGPPPLGGDVPGFLATGDLPPVGDADESWVATPAEQPSEDFLGSQCETVNWARTGAASAATRVYLVPSSAKFGLNDIVLTMKNEKAAQDLVDKVRADVKSCSKRQLTASVTEPDTVKAVGASGAEVAGWTSTVSQKTTDGTQRYRIGIVSSGAKVAYTFLNPLPGGYDLTQDEWDTVAARAGQRMTQVS